MLQLFCRRLWRARVFAMLFFLSSIASVRSRFGGCLAVLALSAAAVAGCASSPPPATPAPLKATSAADYFPLEPGWKWAYELEREGQHMLAVYSVLERVPEGAIVQAGDQRITYGVNRDGIAIIDVTTGRDFVLKNPIVRGATWNVFAGMATVTAVDKKVSVPSGEYANCVVVETLRHEPTRVSRTTFAPGVGPVSIEVQVETQGKFVTTLRAELRGATKPGQDPLAFSN
jgi:hypothetical protein